jgi:Pro-kumamolisin, activation domain/IPT/TIG domain
MKLILPAVAALAASFVVAAPPVAASAATTVSAVSAGGSPVPVSVVPAPMLPTGASEIGAVPASATQTATVVLRPRDPSALTGFIASVTDRQSPLFHRYLARGQFARTFGPAPATVDAVRSWLRSSGLQVTSVASDGLVISVKATATRMERAFGTGLDRVRLAGGAIGQTATSAVRMPSDLAGAVTTVLGLDSLARLQPLGLGRAAQTHTAASAHPAATGPRFSHPAGSPDACPDAVKAAAQFGGLTDDQIANAYGAFGLYSAGDMGASQSIAVYELEPFLPSDIWRFDACYFGAHAATQMATRLHVIPVDGGQPRGPGSGEAFLDVEDISAIAPGATINVYEGPSPSADGTDYDPVDGYVAIVDADADQVVSTSWGLCEQAIQAGQPGLQEAENELFEQAAAQGQTIFAAAGDTGSDDCNTSEGSTPAKGQNPLSVDDPGSQPYVVSAGGTTIDDATQPPAEHVWNDGAQGGGGGGGISMSWPMPSWQRDTRVPGIVRPGAGYTQANAVEQQYGYPQNFCQAYLVRQSPPPPCRTVPDVSAQADEFTGAITVYSQENRSPQTPDGWATSGGTSSAAPQWAAMLALVNASPTCEGNPATSAGVGFASPLLYAVASDPAAYHASFTDVTEGNNDTYGLDNGEVFPATKGYDLASGLGSAQLTAPGGKAGLAYYLCSYGGLATRPLVTSLSPQVLPVAGGTVTITGSGFTTSGASDVARIQVGGAQIPPWRFTVNSDTSITAHFPTAAATQPPDTTSTQDGAGPAAVTVLLKSGEPSMPGPGSTMQYVDTGATGTVPTVTGVVAYGGRENDPRPETILGSGFTGATAVTFGGVAARHFTVDSPYEISVTPPVYSSRTQCAPLPTTGVYAGENASNDICQVQVQVTNPDGMSATGSILPPLEGPIVVDSLGVLVPPRHCGCEIAPGPTEFDYVPTPTITSVSTSASDPQSLASERGTSVITVTGTGLNPLSIEWANFGSPVLESSQDLNFVYETGTQLQITALAEPITVEPASIPFSVRSLGGLSAQATVTYAGVPTVTSALNTQLGHNGAADTGGAPMQVTGQGFAQAVGPIEFASGENSTTEYTYTVVNDTSITAVAPGANPGRYDVEVCTETACSHNPPADYFYLYPPGNPSVTSVSPASGPAAGGTKVTIGGQNLGCVTGVFFGAVAATKFSNPKALLYCGSTSLVDAVAPPGVAGAKVKVTVTTVESQDTGYGSSKSTAFFTYAP